MFEPIWIPKEMAQAIHLRQLAEHSGGAGTRDEGLLESALQRPQDKFAYEGSGLFVLAASYAFGIARNHPFIDGNKRTALVVSFTFLYVNGFRIVSPQEENTRTFLALAAGDLSESQLAQWFEINAVPR